LLALRISTGETLPWTPPATLDRTYYSYVGAVTADPERVYAALWFYDAFAGITRPVLRAFSRASGAQLWSYEAYGNVYALATEGTRLIAGGDFFSPPPSHGLLALDAATGAEIPWGGTPTGGEVQVLLATPAGLAVGGSFTSAGGQPRAGLAMLDP